MDVNEMAAVLEKAADLYEAEQIEWCQNEYFDLMFSHDGETQIRGACAMGSIRYALTGDINLAYDFDDEAPRHLREAEQKIEARLIKHLLIEHVPAWNDSFTRTKQQVIDTFKTVAKDLRNEVLPPGSAP